VAFDALTGTFFDGFDVGHNGLRKRFGPNSSEVAG
jgi:hypothetical protein